MTSEKERVWGRVKLANNYYTFLLAILNCGSSITTNCIIMMIQFRNNNHSWNNLQLKALKIIYSHMDSPLIFAGNVYYAWVEPCTEKNGQDHYIVIFNAGVCVAP